MARVVDTCPACLPNNINIDRDAFLRLGGSPAAGTLPVTFRPIECSPPPSVNISVAVTEYRPTEGGWLRLVLANLAGSTGVASVELRQSPLAVSGAQAQHPPAPAPT